MTAERQDQLVWVDDCKSALTPFASVGTIIHHVVMCQKATYAPQKNSALSEWPDVTLRALEIPSLHPASA
jgi:hypothetical protein